MVQELLEKLKEAEESHGSLQAECDQYRTVLAETVSKTLAPSTCSLHVLMSHSSSSSGGDAETSAEQCRGRRASMEVQDGDLRRAAEAGKLNLVGGTSHHWRVDFPSVCAVINVPCHI